MGHIIDVDTCGHAPSAPRPQSAFSQHLQRNRNISSYEHQNELKLCSSQLNVSLKKTVRLGPTSTQEVWGRGTRASVAMRRISLIIPTSFVVFAPNLANVFIYVLCTTVPKMNFKASRVDEKNTSSNGAGSKMFETYQQICHFLLITLMKKWCVLDVPRMRKLKNNVITKERRKERRNNQPGT